MVRAHTRMSRGDLRPTPCTPSNCRGFRGGPGPGIGRQGTLDGSDVPRIGAAVKSGPGRWDLVYVSKRTALLQDWVHHKPARNKGIHRPIARVPSENRFMNSVIRDD